MRTLLLALIFPLLGAFGAERARADELTERRAIISEAGRAFEAADYDALEAVSRGYLADKRRTESGTWAITFYHMAFGFRASREEDYATREEKLRAWIGAYPDSPTAHVILASAFINRAFFHRGEGASHTVTPRGWQEFSRYVGLAREALERAKAVSAANPAWYAMMVEVAKLEGWELGEMLALFGEAIEREPAYYDTYFRALDYFLPKWGGSREKVARFLDGAVSATRASEGTGLYARIFWAAKSNGAVRDPFAELPLAWPKVKQGFEDILVRYPSDWNLNAYGNFACQAGDKPATRDVLDRIGPRLIPEAWHSSQAIELCRTWVRAP